LTQTIPAKVAVAAVMYDSTAELDNASKLTEREGQCTTALGGCVGLTELRDGSIENFLIRLLQECALCKAIELKSK
jgi:hypothetical protein